MKGRILLGGVLVAAMLCFVVIAAVTRANRPVESVKPVQAERPKAKPQEVHKPPPALEPDIQVRHPKASPEKQGAALHDATLLGLIQNAKVAQQRGDMRTRDAMLAGLKKQPERSRELLAKELSKAQDRPVAYALETLIQELQ